MKAQILSIAFVFTSSLWTYTTASNLPNDYEVLYNTYANIDGACMSDCALAVKQVCGNESALNSPMLQIDGISAFVQLNSTQGDCFVRYVNANATATGNMTSVTCQAQFSALMNTTGTPDDTSCTKRFGGMARKMNADSSSAGGLGLYYGPVNTPHDGYKPSLDGVPPDGVIPVVGEMFGYNISTCGLGSPQITTSSIPLPNSMRVTQGSSQATSRRRDLMISSSLEERSMLSGLFKSVASGFVAVGSIFCVGLAFSFGAELATAGLIIVLGPVCLGGAIFAYDLFKQAQAEVTAAKAQSISDTSNNSTSTSTSNDDGRKKRRTRTRTLTRRITSSGLTAETNECSTTGQARISAWNECVARAYEHKCQTL